MATTKDLLALKVGSRVVVHYRGDKVLGSIDRETKTTWVVGNTKFRKSDGEQTPNSGSYWNPFITPATQSDVDWFIRRRLIAKLNEVTEKDLAQIRTEDLEECCRVLGLTA